jgi:CO/xanthine dehydrogenase Mo-binding subunit
VGEPPNLASTPAIAAALRAASGRPVTRVPVRPDDLLALQ